MTAPRVPSSASTAGALVAVAALLTACSSAPAPANGQAQQAPARPSVVTMDERAAANAGIMGFITAASFPAGDDLRSEVRRCRALAGSNPFGVNIAIAHGDKERARVFVVKGRAVFAQHSDPQINVGIELVRGGILNADLPYLWVAQKQAIAAYSKQWGGLTAPFMQGLSKIPWDTIHQTG